MKLAVPTFGASLLAACTLLSTASAQTTPTPPTAADPKTADVRPLTLGQPVERELKGGETHTYTITAKAGDYIHIVVEQKGIDVVVTLLAPDGKEIIEVDSPNGTKGPEPLLLVLDASGAYKLDVASPDKISRAGRYEANLLEQRAGTNRDRSRIAADKTFAEALAQQQKGTLVSLRGASEKFQEGLALFRSIGDRSREADVLINLGIVHLNLGEHAKALDFLAAALEARRTIGDKKGEARALSIIGVVYYSTGDHGRALEYYEKALALSGSVGDKVGEAAALSNIGLTYSALSKPQLALDYLQRALPLHRGIGDANAEASTLNNLGLAYVSIGEYGEALKYYNLSLPIRRAMGDKRSEAVLLNNIGRVYAGLADYEKALANFNSALVLRRLTGDRAGEASTLVNIGALYQSTGRKKEALPIEEEALRISRQIGDRSREADITINLGALAAELGDHPAALKYVARALVLIRLTGNTQREADGYTNLFEAFATSNRPLAALFGKNSVNVYQKTRLDTRGLPKDVQQSYLKFIEGPYRRLADSLLRQGRLAEAERVLNFFKDQQYFDFSQDKPSELVKLTPREARYTEIFEGRLAAAVAARRSFDALKRQIGARPTTPDEQGQLRHLEEQLESAVSDFISAVTAADADLAAAPPEAINTTDNLGEMQNALTQISSERGDPAVAVYTLAGLDFFDSLVITPAGSFTTSIPIKAAEFNEKSLALWNLLRSPKYDPRPAAEELYKIVFAPVEAKLPKGTKTILWSLDGNLRYIPISALYDGKKYLVERYQNVVFTRADKEQMTREPARDISGAGFGSSEEHTVALAGETMRASALPEVKTELARIFGRGGGTAPSDNGDRRSARGAVPGDVLLDRSFTKAAMMTELEKHRPLVHIASHFRFEPGDEARSFLLLGDGTPFTLDEMKQKQDLFKGVDLLTLSACETAAQKPDANGREVDGFAELAQRLGAASVMASLWKVSDSSTAELMARFYSDYAGSKRHMSKAAALRAAQLALLKGRYASITDAERQLHREDASKSATPGVPTAKLVPFKPKRDAPFAHPFYWSPFILIGNWK